MHFYNRASAAISDFAVNVLFWLRFFLNIKKGKKSFSAGKEATQEMKMMLTPSFLRQNQSPQQVPPGSGWVATHGRRRRSRTQELLQGALRPSCRSPGRAYTCILDYSLIGNFSFPLKHQIVLVDLKRKRIQKRPKRKKKKRPRVLLGHLMWRVFFFEGSPKIKYFDKQFPGCR